MNTAREWVGYVTRTRDQIRDSVLTVFQTQIPEMTDHTLMNPFVAMIEVWAGIAEMLGYYIDSAAREVFLPTARKYSSAVKISRLLDYRIRSAFPAQVRLRFYLASPAVSPVNIPSGTVVRTDENVLFTTNATVTIAAGETEVFVDAIQRERVENVVLGTTSGVAAQEVQFPDETIADVGAEITIGSTNFLPQETLAYSNSTDAHVVLGLNEAGRFTLKLGDGISGLLPSAGETINADYYRTAGAAGNVGAGTITTLVSSIPGSSGLQVTNPDNASGGTDPESLEQLRTRMPLASRTLNRAVTEEDYRDIALMAQGVARAGVFFNCGKTVDVYIVPTGGGVPTQTLLDYVSDWFDLRRMITTAVRVLPAGEVPINMAVSLVVLPNYVRVDVVAAVTARLNQFFSPEVQDIRGEVSIGDVYEVIETTPGVKNSRILYLVPVPYARPVGSTSSVLNWTRNILPESVDVHAWLVQFLSDTQFQVRKDNNVVGQYNVGDLVAFDEISFTVLAPVLGSYSTGDEFEFYSYPYEGGLKLQEFSIPTAGSVTINASGGIV